MGFETTMVEVPGSVKATMNAGPTDVGMYAGWATALPAYLANLNV